MLDQMYASKIIGHTPFGLYSRSAPMYPNQLKMSTKIFNSVCYEIQGDVQVLTWGQKLCSKSILGIFFELQVMKELSDNVEITLPLRNLGEKQRIQFLTSYVIQIIIYDIILHYSIDDHCHQTLCCGVNPQSHNIRQTTLLLLFLCALYRSTLLPFRKLTHLQKS